MFLLNHLLRAFSLAVALLSGAPLLAQPSAKSVENSAQAALAADTAQLTQAQPPLKSQQSVQRVILAMGRCRGHCPVYRVEVDQSGEVLLFDHPNAGEVAGRGKITEADWQRILDAINETHFDRLQSRYITKADGCRALRTDASSFSITVVQAASEQRLQFYSGCEIPERAKIMWLADTIASITGARDWWLENRRQQVPRKRVE